MIGATRQLMIMQEIFTREELHRPLAIRQLLARIKPLSVAADRVELEVHPAGVEVKPSTDRRPAVNQSS